MKSLYIKAYSYRLAVKKAEDYGVSILKNATNAWRRAGAPKMGTVEFTAFKYMYATSNNLDKLKNVGCIITIRPGEDRYVKYPYRIHWIKNEKRPPMKRKYYVRIRKEIEKILGVFDKKADAARFAKKVCKEQKLEVVCTREYDYDGDHTAFVLTPFKSPKAFMGEYIVFGVEEEHDKNEYVWL